MKFYYDYETFPGTLGISQAAHGTQIPAPKAAEPAAPQPAEEKKPEPPPPAHATPQPSAQEPVNPWLAPNPTANPASGLAQHIYYTYMPRYSNVAAPPPQDPTPVSLLITLKDLLLRGISLLLHKNTLLYLQI